MEPGHNEVRAIESGGGGAGWRRRDVKEGVMSEHIGAHIVSPLFHLWSNIIQKGREESHRPMIIMWSAEWFMRNRAMAAPDQIDLVPISFASNPPKVGRPPKKEQV